MYKLLDETYNLKNNPNIFFAGQISGVEGYVESISSGLVAGINAVNKFKKQEKIIFSVIKKIMQAFMMVANFHMQK